MNVNRILPVQNENTLKTLQDFLVAWWGRVGLDAMLAPVELPDHSAVTPQVIFDPAKLANVNPFAPVMLVNTATVIQDFVRDHPNQHLAVILRPCELRALIELRKRHRVYYQPVYGGNEEESLILIGVDCPGTFSQEEYDQHLLSLQNGETEMLHVGLSYGKKESYVPHEVRATCQMCDSPAPLGADLVVGTIGIEPQGNLLLIARNEEVDGILRLQEGTDRMAAEQQVVCREVMVGKLVDQRTEIRSALMNQDLPKDFTSILALFARCTLCADCLDACPLYDGELAGMLGAGDGRQNGRPLLSELIRVSRWLASCSGCGMCRESCQYGIPLTQIVTNLSHRIQHELHYRPGDPNQRLPWMPEKLMN